MIYVENLQKMRSKNHGTNWSTLSQDSTIMYNEYKESSLENLKYYTNSNTFIKLQLGNNHNLLTRGATTTTTTK